jgi:hypothetical protein
MNTIHKHTALALTTLALLSLSLESLHADVFWNGSADPDWANAANWTGGLPSAPGAGNAIINPGAPNAKPVISTVVAPMAGQTYISIGAGMQVIGSGSLTTAGLITGIWGNSNVVDIAGGALTITGTLNLGASGYDGKINISGGSVTANNLSINSSGGARMNIGGTGSFIAPISNLGNINYWVTNNIIMAGNGAPGWSIVVDTTSNPGNVILTAFNPNNVFTAETDNNYADSGNWNNGRVPTLAQSAFISQNRTAELSGDPSPNHPGTLYVGQGAGSDSGTLEVFPAGVLSPVNLIIGRDGSSSGTINQSGGTVTVTGGTFHINSSSNGTGNYILSDGSLATTSAPLLLGGGTGVTTGTGDFTMSGGTLSLGAYFSAAFGSGTTANVSFSGGNATIAGSLTVGRQGKGLVEISGTANVNPVAVQVVESGAGAADSTLSVSGGTLAVGRQINVGNSVDAGVASSMVISGGAVSWNAENLSTGLFSAYSDVKISGDTATIGSNQATDALFNVRANGKLRYELAANGSVALINVPNATMGIASGAQLIIDGSALSLGAGSYSITLVDHNGYSAASGFGATSMSHSFVGFGPTYTPTISYEASAITLHLSVGGGSDYDSWKSTNNVTGGPNDDDDGDGVKNFNEYAFGLDPKSGSSANPISSALDKATGIFKYTRRKQSLTGVAYTYESSTTLVGTWPAFTPDSATSNNGDPVEEITVGVPNALLANPAFFIRVKAVQP